MGGGGGWEGRLGGVQVGGGGPGEAIWGGGVGSGGGTGSPYLPLPSI